MIWIHRFAVCMASTGRLRFRVYRHWFTNRKPIMLEVLVHFLNPINLTLAQKTSPVLNFVQKIQFWDQPGGTPLWEVVGCGVLWWVPGSLLYFF